MLAKQINLNQNINTTQNANVNFTNKPITNSQPQSQAPDYENIQSQTPTSQTVQVNNSQSVGSYSTAPITDSQASLQTSQSVSRNTNVQSVACSQSVKQTYNETASQSQAAYSKAYSSSTSASVVNKGVQQQARTTNQSQVHNEFATTNQSSNANAPITDKMPQAVDNDHTPVYHAHDAQGWSNDVQTITQNSDGTYNIYFLHSVDGATNPFGTNGQDWEHVTTKDWEHFQDQGISINSHGTDDPNSWKSAWTGSIIKNNGDILGVPKGAEVAYFSGLSKKDGSQNIYAAWSDDDGKTFTHALNNGAPVLAWNQSGASQQVDQERDADVIYWNGKLLMYTAEGDKIGVYQSQDGVHWTKADPNGASKVMPGTFFNGLNWQANNVPVECPQIRLMKSSDGDTKAVLFYGAKDPNGKPAQTTGTYYVVGHLDQNGMFAADQNATRLDLGSDYYGTNVSGNDNLDIPKSSLIGLGWVGNWNYTSAGVYNNQNNHQYPADKSQLENHLGAYTSPRTLTLEKIGNQYQIVSKIDLPLSTDNTVKNDVKNDPVVGKDNPYGNVYKIYDQQTPASQIFTVNASTSDGKPYAGRIYIHIGQGKDAVTFNYDTGNGMLAVSQNAVELENDMNKDAASNYQKGTTGNGYVVDTGYKASDGTPFNLTFYCDKTSIELQLPNGKIYTVARYANDDNQEVSVYAQDPNGDNQISLEKQSLQQSNKPVTNSSASNNNSSSIKSNSNKDSTSDKGSQSTSGSHSMNSQSSAAQSQKQSGSISNNHDLNSNKGSQSASGSHSMNSQSSTISQSNTSQSQQQSGSVSNSHDLNSNKGSQSASGSHSMNSQSSTISQSNTSQSQQQSGSISNNHDLGSNKGSQSANESHSMNSQSSIGSQSSAAQSQKQNGSISNNHDLNSNKGSGNASESHSMNSQSSTGSQSNTSQSQGQSQSDSTNNHNLVSNNSSRSITGRCTVSSQSISDVLQSNKANDLMNNNSSIALNNISQSLNNSSNSIHEVQDNSQTNLSNSKVQRNKQETATLSYMPNTNENSQTGAYDILVGLALGSVLYKKKRENDKKID